MKLESSSVSWTAVLSTNSRWFFNFVHHFPTWIETFQLQTFQHKTLQQLNITNSRSIRCKIPESIELQISDLVIWKSVMKAMVVAERSWKDDTTVRKIKLKSPISQLEFDLSNWISNLSIKRLSILKVSKETDST